MNSDDAERKFRIVCFGFDSVGPNSDDADVFSGSFFFVESGGSKSNNADVFFGSFFFVESGGSKSNNDDATARGATIS